MNLTALTGNLGNDPESIYTSEGAHIAKFSLAFDSGKKDKTNWIQVAAFKKLADAVAKYLHKGARVAVVATLDQNKWEDDQGQSRSNHQLIARNIDFLKTDGRGFDNNDGQSPDYGDDDPF